MSLWSSSLPLAYGDNEQPAKDIVKVCMAGKVRREARGTGVLETT